MAIQAALKFNGTAGDVIFYRRLGTYCMRSRPGSVRQTTASQQAAAIFAQAARLGKSIRLALSLFISKGEGKTLMYKLDAALRQWMHQGMANGPVNQLRHFELNSRCSFDGCFNIPLTVTFNDCDTRIHIPPINPAGDIKASNNTSIVELHITAISCHPADASVYDNAQHVISYSYTNSLLPAQDIILPLSMEPGSLLLMAAALKYKCGDATHHLPNVNWQPAVIISAVNTL